MKPRHLFLIDKVFRREKLAPLAVGGEVKRAGTLLRLSTVRLSQLTLFSWSL